MLPLATDYRRGDYERAPRQQPVETPFEQPQREVTRIRARATSEAQRADQRASFSESLSTQQRTALQAYQNNGPTIEERLGVELAGIDIYA